MLYVNFPIWVGIFPIIVRSFVFSQISAATSIIGLGTLLDIIFLVISKHESAHTNPVAPKGQQLPHECGILLID